MCQKNKKQLLRLAVSFFLGSIVGMCILFPFTGMYKGYRAHMELEVFYEELLEENIELGNDLAQVENSLYTLLEESIKDKEELKQLKKFYSIKEQLPNMEEEDINYLIQKESKGLIPVPLNELLGLIRLESNGWVNAKNRNSSAYGYGQFIEKTGIWVASKLNIENYEHGKAPGYQQIDMICWYLSFLKERFPKSYLIHYNGGELGERYSLLVREYAQNFEL